MSAWAERLADRSPIVQHSRDRSLKQARVIIDAARRLISERGENFTTQDLIREAGVALQTFYRYFGGKDELLLAVLEDMIAEACAGYKERAQALASPVDRLHSYVTAVVESLTATEDSGAYARFVAFEHWRLSRQYPDEIGRATNLFTELLRAEIAAATEAGELHSTDPRRDAWLTNQLLLSVFHRQALAHDDDADLATDLWRYCVNALGGGPEHVHPNVGPRRRRPPTGELLADRKR
jgi:TetR/AcrR family transcriptional regulator